MNTPYQSISSILSSLFESISFSEGHPPKLVNIKRLFTTDATIIHVKTNNVVKWNLDAMIDSFYEQISNGRLLAHTEKCISKHIQLYDRIAHAWCEYEGYAKTPESERFWRGYMSIQLIQMNQDWLINHMVWQDETEQ